MMNPSFFLSLILLGSLPFQFALPLFGGFEAPIARVLALFAVLSFCVERLWAGQYRIASPFSHGFLISFLIFTLASFFYGENSDLAFPKIAFLWNILPLFFVWQYEFQNEKKLMQSLWALLFGALGSAFFALLLFLAQFFFGVSTVFHTTIDRILPFFLGRELAAMVAAYPSLLVNIEGVTWLRATALFPDPHVASFFFGLTGFLALALFGLRPRPVLLFIALTLFFIDILTFSRGGYIGLFVGGIVYVITLPKERWPNISRFLPLALGCLLVAALFSGPVVSRFVTSFTLDDASSLARLSLWEGALQEVSASPILGVGLGNYLSIAQPLAEADTPFYAHNLFLDLAVELGLPGTFFFFGWIIASFWRRIFHPAPDSPGIFAALALYCSHSIFETALFSLHITLLLVYLIALLARPKSGEIATIGS